MRNDSYQVQYQDKVEDGKFNPWITRFRSESLLEVVAHLSAMHNNKDAANSKVRVMRFTEAGSYIIKF